MFNTLLIKRQETIMQAVLRTYSGKGAKELFDVLEKRAAEVEGYCVASKDL
jgi:hypothetical protein